VVQLTANSVNSDDSQSILILSGNFHCLKYQVVGEVAPIEH